MTQVRLVATNIKGLPVGDSHWKAHPEALVQQARAMHAQGNSTRAISQELGNGIHAVTVWRWVSGINRGPATRVIARRSIPKSSAVNRQQPSSNPANTGHAGESALGRTVKNTDSRTTMNATDTPNIVLSFGKYAGYSTARIATHDPRYLFWLATLPSVRAQPKLWAAIRAHVLANLLAELEVEMYGDLA